MLFIVTLIDLNIYLKELFELNIYVTKDNLMNVLDDIL